MTRRRIVGGAILLGVSVVLTAACCFLTATIVASIPESPAATVLPMPDTKPPRTVADSPSPDAAPTGTGYQPWLGDSPNPEPQAAIPTHPQAPGQVDPRSSPHVYFPVDRQRTRQGGHWYRFTDSASRPPLLGLHGGADFWGLADVNDALRSVGLPILAASAELSARAGRPVPDQRSSGRNGATRHFPGYELGALRMERTVCQRLFSGNYDCILNVFLDPTETR